MADPFAEIHDRADLPATDEDLDAWISALSHGAYHRGSCIACRHLRNLQGLLMTVRGLREIGKTE